MKGFAVLVSALILSLGSSAGSTENPITSLVKLLPDGSTATFESDGVRLTSGDPLPGRELMLHLESIRAGTQTVWSRALTGAEKLRELVKYARGPVDEFFAPSEGGVEQYFYVYSPLGAGDLVVTMSLSTGLTPSAEDGGVVFRDGGNPIFRYSKATIFDATGASLEISVGLTGGTMTLLVPDAWLQTAQYPLNLDPVLGSAIQISANHYSSTALTPDKLIEASFGSASDSYLGVYALDNGGQRDVHGNLVNAGTGGVSGILNIDVSANSTSIVACSYNSSVNRWLVCWADSETMQGAPAGVEIRGIILDANGTPVGGSSSFNVSAGTSATVGDWFPDIASSGTHWLVSWTQLTGTNGDIRGRIVNGTSTNGAPAFVTASFNIETGANNQRNSAVAYGPGGNYLVVWVNFTVAGRAIHGRTVSATGTVGGTLNRYDAAAAGFNRETPDVTANLTDSEFLVAWDEFSTTTALADVYVRRATSAGVPMVIASGVDVDPNSDALSVACTWNDSTNQYFIVWADDGWTSFNAYRIECARLAGIDASVLEVGTVLSPQNILLSIKRFTSAASRTGTSHVVAMWAVPDGGSPNNGQVNLQRFDMSTGIVSGGGGGRNNPNGDEEGNDALCSARSSARASWLAAAALLALLIAAGAWKRITG